MIVCCYSPFASPEEDPHLKAIWPLLNQEGVHFRGGLTKEKLAQVYLSSLLLLYPNTSTGETSCIAAIEAMAAGCPVVTSNLGALPETVPHQKAGWIVPYDVDPVKLVESLERACLSLLSDEKHWQRLSHQAREYAYSKFTWSAVAQEWLVTPSPLCASPSRDSSEKAV